METVVCNYSWSIEPLLEKGKTYTRVKEGFYNGEYISQLVHPLNENETFTVPSVFVDAT